MFQELTVKIYTSGLSRKYRLARIFILQMDVLVEYEHVVALRALGNETATTDGLLDPAGKLLERSRVSMIGNKSSTITQATNNVS